MIDRELLELAAKAAGLMSDGWHGDGGIAVWDEASKWRNWSPLTDDGDAFRLAVRLNLLSGPEFWRERSVQAARAAFTGDRQDHYADTRRAIVWAAADIGKREGDKP